MNRWLRLRSATTTENNPQPNNTQKPHQKIPVAERSQNHHYKKPTTTQQYPKIKSKNRWLSVAEATITKNQPQPNNTQKPHQKIPVAERSRSHHYRKTTHRPTTPKTSSKKPRG